MRARWSGRSTDAPERASGSSSRSASETLCLIRGGPALRSWAAALRAYFGADFIPERNMSCIFSLRDRAARLAWASGRAARRRSAPLPECKRRRVCGYEGLDQPGDDDVASFELCPASRADTRTSSHGVLTRERRQPTRRSQVIGEDGELDEAEPEPFARIGEALFDRTEAALASQVPHARGDAQGDEHDARLVELRTSLVRHPGPRRLPLAPGALSLSAPLRNLQCELFHLIGESLPKRPHIGHRSPDRSWDASVC